MCVLGHILWVIPNGFLLSTSKLKTTPDEQTCHDENDQNDESDQGHLSQSDGQFNIVAKSIIETSSIAWTVSRTVSRIVGIRRVILK